MLGQGCETETSSSFARETRHWSLRRCSNRRWLACMFEEVILKWQKRQT
jgi:hypothetical protein